MTHDETPVQYWQCPNCGQVHFGDAPPDMCAFCRDFTTWRLIAGHPPPRHTPPTPETVSFYRDGDMGDSTQLPLFPEDEAHHNEARNEDERRGFS